METKSAVDEEKKEEEVPSGSWSFSSFLQTAKQKSSEAYEFMKRDLTEFKDTVQGDTVSAVSSTASYIRNAIQSLSIEEEEDEDGNTEVNKEESEEKKEGASGTDISVSVDEQTNQYSLDFIEEKAKNILSSVVEIFKGTVFPNDEEEEEICVVIGNTVVNIPKERWNMLVAAVQNDPQTYIHEPQGPPDNYATWLKSFNLINHENEVQQLLATVPDVHNFYSKLVPSSITHDEFWHRYFYRIHQLVLLEELRKEKLSINLEEVPENVNVEMFTEQPIEKKSLSDENLKVTTNEAADMVVVKRKGDESSSSSPSDATKVSEGSEDWEKAELSEIVDEAEKRVSEKLKGCDEKQCSEEFNEWEFQ